MEIEAKFITKEGIFKEILNLKDIAGYKVKDVLDISEADTYLDTEDLDLHRQEISFRIRKQDSKFLVTLKEKPVRTGAIYSRFEEEEYIGEKEIPKVYDYSLKIKPVAEAKRLTEGKKLFKIFTIDKKRKRIVIVKNGNMIRLDMDTIQFLIEGIKKKEHELEIEAKNTPMEEVEKVQEFLKQKFGNALKPSKRSKYERGIELLASS